MAKREKIDLDRFDDFDLEDNWGMDPAPPQSRDGNNNRNPIKKAGKTVLKEMGKTTFSAQMAKAILKEALPRSFTTTLDNADKALYDTRALYNDVRRDASPMLREMKTLGRTLNRLVPTRYQDRINTYLSNNADKTGNQLANLNLEDAAVLQSLSQIFDRNEDKPQQLTAEEITEKLTDQEYKVKLGTAIASIQNLLAKQTAYQFGAQRAFQKKSMELQIRQLMVARSHLDVATKSAVETSNLLRSIVENTGLPDVVKQHRSEEFFRLGREKVFGRIQRSMYDWSADYRNQIKDRAKQAISDRVQKLGLGFSMANSTLEQVEMQREMLASMGVTPEEFMAGAAGNWGALQIGKRAGKFINRRAPGLRRLDGTFQGVNYLFNNKERLLSDWGNSGYRYGKWYNPAENFLKDTLRGAYKDNGIVRSGSIGGGDKVSSVDERKLSYMEEMTGYLSRILHSIDIMRTGNPKAQRTVFNRQKGIFTTFDESVTSTRQALLKDSDIETQRDNIERLITSIDPTGRLSSTARGKISDFLMTRARTSKAFNPGQIANEKISGLSRDDARLWQGLLAKRYGLKLNEKSEWTVDPFSSSNVNLNVDAGQYNYASGQTQGLFNRAHGLAQTGNMEELIAEGALVFKNGNWEINPEYYANRVAGRRTSGSDPSNPAPNRPGQMFGFGGTPQDVTGLRRFGQDWSNPNSVNFNVNGKETNSFKEALEEQTNRILDSMSSSQSFWVETMPRIEAQLASMEGYGSGNGGSGNESSNGSDSVGRRFNRRNLLRSGLRGLGAAGKAYWKATGLPFTLARKALSAASKPFGQLAGGGISRVLGMVSGFGSQLGEKIQDGYVMTTGGMKKVIDKQGLASGRYIDQATGKVINKLSDIKGAVWDVIGNTQVLSDEEARNGLFNAAGQRIKTSLSNALNFAKKVTLGGLSPFGIARGAMKIGGSILSNAFNRIPDLYVNGEKSPRVYASKLMKGEYYSLATGKRISSLKDLIGGVGVIDPATRKIVPVISAEEVAKGLVDRSGKLVRTGIDRVAGMAGSILRGGLGLITSPWKMASQLGGGAARILRGGLNAVGEGFTGGRGGGLGGGNLWLKRIYRLLVNQFTGKNPLDGLEDTEDGLGGMKNRLAGGFQKLKNRTGSWWQRLQKKKPEEAKPEHAEKAAKEGGGWGKLIWAAITGVGAVIGKIASGFGNFWKWIKDLPRWLGAARAASTAGDVLGDVAGGGKRGKGGLLRRAGGLLKRAGKGALGVAGFLGRGLFSGAGMLARAGVAAAGALTSVVSAPVLITAAVAAGVGYLIYKGYQAYKNKLTLLRKYRVAQYGVSPKDDDKAGKVLALEEAVLKNSQIDGQGKLKIGGLPFQDLLSGFGIEITDQRSVQRWTRWYQLRFVPVFTRNVETLHRMDPKAKITDADFLKESQRGDFARATFIASNGNQAPYLVSDSPFLGISSVTGDKFVADWRDQVISEYANAEKKAIASGEKKVTAFAETKAPNATEILNRKVKEANSGVTNRNVNPATDLYYSPGDTRKGMASITGDLRKDELIEIGNRIDDLTAIRMKLYGLGELVKDDVNTLIPLENEAMKFVRYGDKGVAIWTGNVEDFFNRWNGQFAVNVNDPNEKQQWIFWFSKRFLPVFLNFCSESNFLSPNSSPMQAWKRLNSSDLLKIANFMNSASALINGGKVSVWTIKASPWPKRISNTDSSVIQSNLDALRSAAKKEVYAEKVKTDTEISKMTFDGKPLRSTALGNKIADLYGDTRALTANTRGRATGSSGVGAYGQRMGSMGTSYERAGAGSNYTDTNLLHSGNGTGGSINDLPDPKGDGWENMKALIAAAANMTGVDAGSLAAMIAQESQFKANAKNKNSSAAGLGQFIDGTWQEMLPILVKKYGVNPNTSQRDPRAAVLATAEYMKQNAQIIGDIGRPLTTTDIYMAHFLGPGGAKKVLSVPSGTPIEQALGDRYAKVAAANKEIFAGVRTTGDLVNSIGGYLSKNGGRYIAEANAMTNKSGPAVPDATGSSDNGTPLTPPVQTPTTPSVNTNPTKGEIPVGSTTSAAVATRGTDTVTPAVNRNSDTRDSQAMAQQAKQRQNSTEAARAAISSARQQSQVKAEETANWVDTLGKQLEVQKEMSQTLTGIKGLLEKGGVFGSQDDKSPKTNPNTAALKGKSIDVGGSGKRPYEPFDTSISPQFR